VNRQLIVGVVAELHESITWVFFKREEQYSILLDGEAEEGLPLRHRKGQRTSERRLAGHKGSE
jgi:hypothetical protein